MRVERRDSAEGFPENHPVTHEVILPHRVRERVVEEPRVGTAKRPKTLTGRYRHHPRSRKPSPFCPDCSGLGVQSDDATQCPTCRGSGRR